MKERYGERWYRLWHLFLGWSWRIGAQGNSECFQVVAHKNLDHFDRTIFLERAALPLRSLPAHARASDAAPLLTAAPALDVRPSERVEHRP